MDVVLGVNTGPQWNVMPCNLVDTENGQNNGKSYETHKFLY
jgi:hypothetical protein